jgi:ribose/xylose/arabinose/galactoside ABC-type transport system permease subunit
VDQNGLLNRLGRTRELPALAMLMLVIGWMALKQPKFFSPENLATLAQDAGYLGMLACGEAFVILTGGVDLSVGAVLAMSACISGSRMMAGMAWPAASLMGLAAGAFAGWLNGAMVTMRKLPPILVTLATLLIFRAGTNVATGAVPYNNLPDPVKFIGKGWIPFSLFLVVLSAFAVALARMRFGRNVAAVGGSEQSARLSGVRTDRVIRTCYVLSGLCAALAGLLAAGGGNNAQWNLAENWELEVIAAVVIGGVRLTGGEGSVIGAGIGALIIVVLRNALFLMGIAPERYGLITAVVILLAALAEQMRVRRAVAA